MRAASILAPSVLLAATLLAGTAHADDADIERARALFDEAGELERHGQWAAAQEKLRAAIKIRETPHLRYALGWALENDDKLLEAKVEYETAVRLARSGGAAEVGRLAADRIEEVERKTPLVEVQVDGGAAAGARLVVDGRATALQRDVVRVPVNPGSRVVRIERPGRPPIEQLVYVPRGMLRVVEVPRDGAGDGDSVASRTASHDRHDGARRSGAADRSSSTLPIVLAAGGAAAAIGGGLLFVSSMSDASARDESMRQWCDATACRGGTTATLPESAEATQHREDANDAATRGNTKQILGATIGGVGLVGAAVGAYLLVRRGDERGTGGPRGKDQRGHRTAGSPTVAPAVSPIRGGAMAGATIRF